MRSTVLVLLVAAGATIGIGILFCASRVGIAGRPTSAQLRSFDPTSFSLNGLFLAQLAIGVLGVLVITSEYTTGQIRATIGATPQRRLMLAAKVLVFTTVAFVVSLLACFIAFFVGQAILSAKYDQAALGDPGVLRAVIGAAGYLAVLGAIGLGLGTILRRTAGAIAALVALLLVLPILVNFLPSPWSDNISRYLPMRAGSALWRATPADGDLSILVGFGVLCGYAALSLACGTILLVRRDA